MILSMDFIGRGALLSSVAIFAMTVGADAQDRGQDRDGVYQLGEIYVAGARGGSGSGSGGGVGGSTATREQMWTFESRHSIRR
jgi:iron complex outermembrane receptor protein